MIKLISRIYKRLQPPVFENEEENRKAKRLFLLTKASIIGFVIILGIRIVGIGSESNLIIPLFVSLLLLSLSHAFLLSKRLEIASYSLLSIFFGLCIYLVIISEHGYHDTGIFAVPGLLIIAGIFLKKWPFYIFTIITLLLIAVLVGLETFQVYKTKFSSFVSPYDGIDIIFIIAITAVSVRILTDSLMKSLQRANENEKALQENEEKYRNLVQYAPTGIYEFDMEKLEFMSVNDIMCEYTGYTKNEFLKLNPFDILSDESKITLTELIEKVFSDQPKELAVEYKLKGKNNGEFWVFSNAKFFYKDGIPKRAMAVVHDLTEIRNSEEERRKLETQLYQARKMEAIGTLAGGIAHDFNNILSGILGYSQLAQRNITTPEKANQNIDQVIKGAKRAAELVQQILTFSRQTEYQKITFPIFLEIEEALKLIRSTIPRNIEIVKNLNSKSMVSADPTKIHQLTMNLCTNAYHAMKEIGGCLTVALTDVQIFESKQLMNKKIVPGKYIKLEVTDTGHGMDQTQIEKAFDPYYTTRDIGEGTGFGLAIVQAVVDEHDAYIKVKSFPGKGTSFSIYFPVVGKKYIEPVDKKSVKTSYLKGNEKILFVDDEEAIREIAKENLERNGYTVLLRKNGIEALKEFQRNANHFDLIITDMNMPGMASDKFLTEIKKINSDIPIILCTGFSETMTEEKATANGINGFLTKPIEMDDLCRKIRQVLDKKDSV